jgi:hypothetical protein
MGVLGALQHLNYRVWYALAEYVDNSIQSAQANLSALQAIHGPDYRLKVSIELDGAGTDSARLIIRDNAAGIAATDYARAFRLASPPPDRRGLSEFGMGMKTASCWLADIWEVRTSALGESTEGRVIFDMASILANKLQTIRPTFAPIDANVHFTEVTLSKLRHNLSGGRTIGKIRLHLGDIFRSFISSGFLELTYCGERITFSPLKPLVAPHYAEPNGQPITWHRPVDFTLNRGAVRVHGFMGLLEKGSTSRAGLVLMRRGRLIRGIDGETYRPAEVFGSSNSFVYQRLYGELTLDGVAVAHTKDEFALESIESELIEAIRSVINDPEMPLHSQACSHRARAGGTDRLAAAGTAASGAADELSKVPSVYSAADGSDQVGPGQDEHACAGTATLSQAPEVASLEGAIVRSRVEHRTFQVDGEAWNLTIEMRDDPSIGDWVSVDEQVVGIGRDIRIVFGLAHPFVQRFATPDSSDLEPLVRLACAIAMAEVSARVVGIRSAGHFRRTINRLLRDAMSSH